MIHLLSLVGEHIFKHVFLVATLCHEPPIRVRVRARVRARVRVGVRVRVTVRVRVRVRVVVELLGDNRGI